MKRRTAGAALSNIAFCGRLNFGWITRERQGRRGKIRRADTILRSMEKVWTQMWVVSIQRECVMLKAFQEPPVRKMAVESPIPCFVSRCLTPGDDLQSERLPEMRFQTRGSSRRCSPVVTYYTTLGHRAAPQAAGRTTFAGTFDAVVRVEGIVGYGMTSLG